MNVLVEMEIPKSCKECPFVFETGGMTRAFCQYVGYESDIEKFVGACDNGRPRWCPFNDAENAVLSQEADCGAMTQMQDQDCHYISLAVRERSVHAAKEDYDLIRRLRQRITEEKQTLNDLERKQLETNLGLLGNALAEQAYMTTIMQGLKKLFMQAGRSDITDCNQEHHPYEFEMLTCDSLMRLYDMNHKNTCALIDAYEKVLKEDDAERAKEA